LESSQNTPYFGYMNPKKTSLTSMIVSVLSHCGDNLPTLILNQLSHYKQFSLKLQ
jgi:hypothetical protein